jgi:hypothetical protein
MINAWLSLSIACVSIAVGDAAGQSCLPMDSSRIVRNSTTSNLDSANTAIDRFTAAAHIDDLKDAIAGMISLSYSDSTRRRHTPRDDLVAHSWIKLIAVADSQAGVLAEVPRPGNLVFPHGPPDRASYPPNIDPKDIVDSAVRAEYEPRFQEHQRRRTASECRAQIGRALSSAYAVFYSWARNNYKSDPASQQAFVAEAMSHNLSAAATRQMRLAFLGPSP